MVEREALLALAERCEKAAADQQREMLIAAAEAVCMATLAPDAPPPAWLQPWDDWLNSGAFLDAAMSLVPEGCWDHIEVYRPDYQDLGWTVHFLPRSSGEGFRGFARTWPLALCAAAIRARAARGNPQ